MKPPYLDWQGVQIEPSPAQKAAGFIAGDRPPAQWWNWQLGTMDAWIKYLGVSLIEANALLQCPREITITDDLRALARNERALCMVGVDAAYSSFDNGFTWAKDVNIYIAGKTLQDVIATGNQQFVAVGDSGHVQRANTSNFDQIWNAPVDSTFGTSTIEHIAVDGGGTLVIAGWDNKCAHSIDAGDTWIANALLTAEFKYLVGNPNAAGFMASAYFEGASVGVADTIWKSADGTAFAAVDLTAFLNPANEWPGSVTYSTLLGGWIVGVENSNGFAGALLSRDNGTTWERLSVESPTIGFVRRASLVAPYGLLLLGEGILGYSASGKDWQYVRANIPPLKMFESYYQLQAYAARNVGTGYTLTAWTY